MTRSRSVARFAAAAAAAGLTVLLTAGPALASNPIGPEDGAHPGKGISPAQTLGLYVLIPGAIFAVIALLAWLSMSHRGERYRPAKGWDAAPVWFAGPADPAAAVAGAQLGDIVRGGGSGSW